MAGERAGDSGAGDVAGGAPCQYDEFGMFHENAAEFGLPYDGPPAVERVYVPMADGRRLSALRWGSAADGPATHVFLHGGAQNAHTWDTLALALDRAVLAIDLPGHGHSDGPGTTTGDTTTASGFALRPVSMAADIAAMLEALGTAGSITRPVHLVGMSLGGLTAIALAARSPRLIASLSLVDVTPGVNARKASAITAFVNGPARFASFDELLARTVEHNPTRTVSSLRRGILHNAVQNADGSWTWRYRRHDLAGTDDLLSSSDGAGPAPVIDASALWDDLSSIVAPVMLVRGMSAQSVVDDEDEAELLRRRPHARIEHVAGAGHSVQGDAPIHLAGLIDQFTT